MLVSYHMGSPSLVKVDKEHEIISEHSNAMRGRHDNDEGKDIINECVEGLQSVSTELNVALPVSSTLQQLVVLHASYKASYPGRS